LRSETTAVPPADITPDPRWFYAAVVGASATLVAIIGGLLVSRLVGLSADRDGIERRLRELGARLSHAKAEHDRIHEERIAVSLDWFVNHHLEDFVARRGDVDIPAAIDDFCPRGSSFEEMEPVAIALASAVQRAFQQIEAEYTGGRLPPRTADEMIRDGLHVQPDEGRAYESVSAAIRNAQRQQSQFAPLMIPPVTSTSELPVQRQDQRIRDEQAAASEAKSLRTQIEAADAELKRVGRPAGIRSVIAVLGYIAAVGVVLPLWVLANEPRSDSGALRYAVLGLFVSGLIALVAYIAWSAYHIGPRREEAD
jgi:hypothetical protein